MYKDFFKFLKEYKIVSLGIAFIIGVASTSLVNSLVNDIIMPIISPFLFGESWRSASLNIGPVIIKWGSFLAELFNFAILAFIVFFIAKKILKEKEIKKK
ncbi:MAG TPA: MscL family protein [Patescibacteria group bacterium]|nr:MscL family protein [Patescibacteria group bacterium]